MSPPMFGIPSETCAKIDPPFGVGHMLHQRRQACAGFERDASVVGLQFAADQFEKCRLAGAVSTDKPDAFATFDVDRHAVQKNWMCERKGDVFYAEECHAREFSGLDQDQKPAVSSSSPANFRRFL